MSGDKLPIVQVDRDAASDWFALTNSLGIDHTGKRFEEALRDGSYDDDNHPLVQAFASHRLAERERCAKLAEVYIRDVGDGDDTPLEEANATCRRIATAIREEKP